MGLERIERTIADCIALMISTFGLNLQLPCGLPEYPVRRCSLSGAGPKSGPRRAWQPWHLIRQIREGIYRNVPVNEVRKVKRVERRVDFHVVVEVDVGVQLFFLPYSYAPGPLGESGWRIASDIKLCVPVKPSINEIGGDFFQVWPLAGCIRHDESHIMIAEQF